MRVPKLATNGMKHSTNNRCLLSVSACPTPPTHIPISASIQAQRLCVSPSRTPVSGQVQRSRKFTHGSPKGRTNPSNGWLGGSESHLRLVNRKLSQSRSIRGSCRLSTKRRSAGISHPANTKSWSGRPRTTRPSQEVLWLVEDLHATHNVRWTHNQTEGKLRMVL